MKEYKIYSGGDFIASTIQMNVINPFNNEIIATTYLSTAEILEKAIEKAKSAEKQMKELPSFVRYNILMNIASDLKSEKQHIAEVLCLESGKPILYALGEIDRAIQTFIVAAEESKRLPREYLSIDWTPAGKNKEGLVRYFPVGIVAGISPFNFPLNLAVHKIAPAIAAGCPIILKPASKTPLSTLELAKILHNTDLLPKGAVSILPMDRSTGNQLVTDDRIKLLTFTGSSVVGWEMKKNCGKKKIVLELGGNAGVIITESADIDDCVRKNLAGGFSYSGQVCIHTQRIYVHENLFNEFTEKFIDGVNNLKFGNPLDLQTEISSMIDEKNAIRVETWVNEAINAGAKLLCGGRREGTYFQPTVLTNTNSEMKVCSNEIFGPVVIIEKYSDFNSAIENINNTRYGLQAGIFTNNIAQMNYAFENINAGGIMLNDCPTFRVDHMPYGGVKDSGIGREGIRYSILDMMESRLLVKS
ncbi:MAG: aldehyde dehydrogenase family protein [Bacteroidota bacterium]|nr:aldehyde dehydrogenase family protein [Bacteroidota bacterium]